MNRWGARPEELERTWPGDDLVREPATGSVMAVSVDAPPEAVWRWLVQVGQGRGGMYSYDWLENLVGLDIHSATQVRPEWQTLSVGDPVTLVRPGWAGLADGYVLRVARVEPPRLLVLRQAPPEHPWDAVWTFVVEPDGAGSRLVSRSRAAREPGVGGWVAAQATSLGTSVTWLMTRKMLLTLKQRAEGGAAGAGPAEVTPSRDGTTGRS
jgi:uncharacterized protein YndB with AHSA1/START domain